MAPPASLASILPSHLWLPPALLPRSFIPVYVPLHIQYFFTPSASLIVFFPTFPQDFLLPATLSLSTQPYSHSFPPTVLLSFHASHYLTFIIVTPSFSPSGVSLPIILILTPSLPPSPSTLSLLPFIYLLDCPFPFRPSVPPFPWRYRSAHSLHIDHRHIIPLPSSKRGTRDRY